jgi:hypothetical protein
VGRRLKASRQCCKAASGSARRGQTNQAFLGMCVSILRVWVSSLNLGVAFLWGSWEELNKGACAGSVTVGGGCEWTHCALCQLSERLMIGVVGSWPEFFKFQR